MKKNFAKINGQTIVIFGYNPRTNNCLCETLYEIKKLSFSKELLEVIENSKENILITELRKHTIKLWGIEQSLWNPVCEKLFTAGTGTRLELLQDMEKEQYDYFYWLRMDEIFRG